MASHGMVLLELLAMTASVTVSMTVVMKFDDRPGPVIAWHHVAWYYWQSKRWL